MRLLGILIFTLVLLEQAPQQPAAATQLRSVQEFKKRIASYPPDEQVYELWRVWLAGQPPDVRADRAPYDSPVQRFRPGGDHA